MGKFAKLIDLENGEQVLLTKSFNEQKKTFKVSVATDFEKAFLEIGGEFFEEHKANEMINNYTKEMAVEFRAVMAALIV